MADNYSREILRSTVSGMDGGVAPDLLKDTQVARMLNCSSRGGHAATRPRFVEYPTTIVNGRFQGAATYRLNDADRIVYCVNGRVYALNLETGVNHFIAEFPTKLFDRAYFAQVDQYFVVQNGIYDPVENWPIVIHEDAVFDNLTAEYYDAGTAGGGVQPTAGFYRINEAPAATQSTLRIPIGKAMAYGQGRLFVAVERFRTFLSGSNSSNDFAGPYVDGNGLRYIIGCDILQTDNVTGVLVASEYTFGIAGNVQVFGLPWEIGFIASMGFFRNSFTGSGLGPLVVVAREGSAAFSVDLPRASWLAIDYANGFAKVLFFGSGSYSPAAMIMVNDDLPYRSRDGLRTIKYTQTSEASSSGSLSNVPYSSEVNEFFARDTRDFLLWSTMAYADNRLITVAGGFDIGNNFGTGFDTLVSLDTSVLNSITASRPARAYDGIWTGPIFTAVVSARYAEQDRVFVFCNSRTAPRNFLAYLDDAPVSDFDGDRPVCRVYSAEYEFENFVLAKELAWADLWFSEVEGDVEVTMYWKQDGVSVWHPCRTRPFSFCAGSLQGAMVQLRLQPDETNGIGCDQVTKTNIRLGTTFQFCIQWTGKAKLKRALFVAKNMTDRIGEQSCSAPTACTNIVASAKDLVLNDFTIYQV